MKTKQQRKADAVYNVKRLKVFKAVENEFSVSPDFYHRFLSSLLIRA